MAKKLKSYRLDEGLLGRVAAYARARGASETQVVEAALEGLLALAEGGVPDLPSAEPAAPALRPIPTLRRASSLAARERANPGGMSRQDRINKAGS